MATNPKIPEQPEFDQQRGPRLVSRPERPTSAMPGVVLAIVTAVLLLAAIFYFMPRAPKAAAKDSTQSLQIRDLKLSAAPVGGTVSLNGQLTNGGSTQINGVMAQVSFPLTGGRLGTVQSPVQGIALGDASTGGSEASTGKVAGDTEELTKDPLKPGETRPVRITVDQVPSEWNHQMPQVRIVATTGTTAE